MAPVVGKGLGPAPLGEDLGQGPRRDGHGRLVGRQGVDRERHRPDGRGIMAEPGQAEPLVEPGPAVVGVGGGQVGERGGGLGQVLQVAAPEPGVPPGAPGSADGREEPILGAGRLGQVGRVGQEVQRIRRRAVLRLDPEGTPPRRPGRQRSLMLQVIPARMDEGQGGVGRVGWRHRRVAIPSASGR